MGGFVRDVTVLALIILVPLAAIIALFMWASSAICTATGEMMSVPSRWGVWTDCMVQVDGKWIPLDAYKVVRMQKP